MLFEYPYIIITGLVIFILVMGAVGAYFALQGVRTAKGKTETDFQSVSKLESLFGRITKERGKRCVLYISVSLDDVRSLYSDSMAWRIYAEIKPIILKTLSDGKESGIAMYDQTNFVVLSGWNAESAKARMELCRAEIGRLLLRHKVINEVEIRFGSYITTSTEVAFDTAINRAKQACTLAEDKDVSHVEWSTTDGKALEQRIKIENNIENEIDNNRFFLEYQPVLDAKTKRIVGAEVLSRLNSENEGVLAPGSFLSAVNSVGLNDKFDYYIFEKNCKWISNHKAQREKYVYTINFSRATLCDPMFAEKIEAIVERYELSYSCIAVEVLEDENVTGEAKKNLVSNLVRLREKGVRILLDDFGSGYTTFGDLQEFSIDTVKIDKSITQSSHEETGYVIMKNVIRTAKELKLKTVCEGIETAEQEQLAIEAGCDMLQGFYYYKPMSVAKLEQLFEKNENDSSGGI